MIINTAGEYTLQYTATDACGNSTTVERDLLVEGPPRTVLYTDGTFIINERSRDIEANIAAHGQPTNVYIPFDPNGATNAYKYIFTSYSNRPWHSQSSSVTSVEIGSEISPSIMQNWFYGFSNCVSFNFDNLDTSHVGFFSSAFNGCSSIQSIDLSGFDTSSATSFASMFNGCSSLESIDLSGFDTHNVTSMRLMFYNCTALQMVDLSGFDTSSVTNIDQMFMYCTSLETIYAPTFELDQITSLSNMLNMFGEMSNNLVGGAGTIWTYSNPTDKTYAKIDGGVSDPGYFTARS